MGPDQRLEYGDPRMMSWHREKQGAGVAMVLVALAFGSGCASEMELPTPRSVIIFSGVRLTADADQMEEVDRWLRNQLEEIHENPSFLIELHRRDSEVRPWETLHIEGDTARIALQTTATDAETPFLLYAHFHLMAQRGELEEWLPEASDAEGFELEQAILDRIADAWFLGRSIYDTHAYAALDELLYSREFGYLQPYILFAQADRFAEEREAWLQESPEEKEEFLEWFRATFERDPPEPREVDPIGDDGGGGDSPGDSISGVRPSTGG